MSNGQPTPHELILTLLLLPFGLGVFNDSSMISTLHVNDTCLLFQVVSHQQLILHELI